MEAYKNLKGILEMNKGEKYLPETDRLCFRKWCDEDIHLANELWGDYEVTKFIDARGKLNMVQVEEKLKREIENDLLFGIQYWPLFLKENNTFIGCCGLRPYDSENNVCEIGFHICSQHWRKGYAKEAASAVIKYAFDILKIAALFAGHNPNNNASAAVLQKLGFIYTHDEFYKPTGLKHPSYLLQNPDI